MNALLTNLGTRGIPVGGVTFTSAFLTGGVFSYDGVHPTQLCYALVANEFIAAINERFNSEATCLGGDHCVWQNNQCRFARGCSEAGTAQRCAEWGCLWDGASSQCFEPLD